MTLGPIEYVVIGFPGNQFKGDIAPALADLIERKVIRVLDLVFIGKDSDGNVLSFEFDQMDELAGFDVASGDSRGLLTDDDIEHAAELLDPDSSAALLVWEDLWAAEFAAALHGANAILLEGGRIPHELAEAALGELAQG
jgi:hypothetical protein